MMRPLIALLFMLILQACQVSEDVASSKQISQKDFANPQFTVALSNDGRKKLGDSINITLMFPYDVTVTGSPYLNVVIGSSTRKFFYHSGSGSKAILFRHVVSSFDNDHDGISVNSNIVLNGGTMTYTDSVGLTYPTPASFTLPESEILVDGSVPYITSVTGPSAESYLTDQHLIYTLKFSEPVNVYGNVTFNVVLNSGAVPVSYASGSGTSTLYFKRKVTVTDFDDDGFSNATTINMAPLSGINITDISGNSLSSVMMAVGSSALVNVTGPSITSITPPAASTYTLGQNLDFTVVFSEPVNVLGTPSINIRLTTGLTQARYFSGTGSNTLIFRYTVASGDADTDGIILLPPMELNGGSIKNISGIQNAALSFTAPSTAGRLVEAVPGPLAITTVMPADKMYVAGEVLDFRLNFNRVITVTGTPRIRLTIGAATVYADYNAGLSSSSSMVFRYTIAAGLYDGDGISLQSPFDLNGGTVRDALARNATLFYSVPDTTGIQVDSLPPTILSVTTVSSGNFRPGQNLNFTLNFNEAVTVSGTPRLAITLDSGTVYADYLTGSGTTSLIFRYNVLIGHSDSVAGIVVNSPLDLNGGSLKDALGHNAILTFSSPSTASISVDGEAPDIASLTPPADATYNIGDNLDFTINWSEPVAIAGTPKIALTLNTGGTVYAVYQNALSTNTASVFRYTVSEAQSDTDGLTIASLITVGSGSIKDMLGNNADPNFPVPATAILIDGIKPIVTSVSVPPNASYTVGANLDFTLTWSEDVAVIGTPKLRITVGTVALYASYVSTSTNTTLFRYTVGSGEIDTDGISMLPAVHLDGGSIKDLPGNDGMLAMTLPSLSNIFIDTITPVSSSAIGPNDDTYRWGQNLDFKVFWPEKMVVTGSPRLVVTVGATNYYANYHALSSNDTMLVFRYTVGSGHTDGDGIEVLPLGALPVKPTIDLNGGTVRDVAGNNATLTFDRPVLTGVLVDGVMPVITAITPPANATYVEGSNLDFTFTFSEIMNVTGTPRVALSIGSPNKYATYVSGTGTNNLVFRYTVTATDEDKNGFSLISPIDLNGGSIQDGALNNGYLYFSTTAYPSIIVDGKDPTISSISTSGEFFKAGDTITYTVNMHESVKVTGNPRIVLTIGNETKYATFYDPPFWPTYRSTLTFRYSIPSDNSVLDLDGITVGNIDMNGGAIEDQANNGADPTVTFTQLDYVYYGNILARYRFSGSDYSTVGCASGSCITRVEDISGNNLDITSASSPGPALGSGFGSNGTSYAQFNNSSWLRLPNLNNVRYYMVIFRTPSDVSTTAAYTTHSMIGTSTSTPFGAVITPFTSLRSNSTTKQTLYGGSTQQSFKQNNVAWTSSSTSHTAPVWFADTEYANVFKINWPLRSAFFPIPEYDLYNGILGGGSFNGQIAEIIFFNSSYSLSDTHLEKVHTQLNTIHGVYP